MWHHILSLDETARSHGDCFNYRSVETDVIAHCIERVTNKRLSDLVSEEVWQPLGCEESANFTVDRSGYSFASGGFNATLRDYGRLGQMLCNGGEANGRTIVPTAWIKDTLREDALPVDEPRERLLPEGGYRNQFWLRHRGKQILMARGIYGQLIYVDQSQNLVAVVLASWPESINVERSMSTLNVIDAVAAKL
jgi:CubicO group peptidase (beta-lactamase class C family)